MAGGWRRPVVGLGAASRPADRQRVLGGRSCTRRATIRPMATVEGDVKGAELTYRLPTVEVARWMAGCAVPEIRVKWPDGRVEVLPLELKMIADQTQAAKDRTRKG